MPFTPAFIDTGKLKPLRYDIEIRKKNEEARARNHSRKTLINLVKRERERKSYQQSKSQKRQHANLNWNFERLKQLISERLLARVKRPEQTMLEAYKLFGVSKDGGVKRNRFAKALRNMGLDLTPQEIAELFNRFDVDHSGFLDFDELVDHCMPKDYVRFFFFPSFFSFLSSFFFFFFSLFSTGL
jgi:hypothetical protein